MPVFEDERGLYFFNNKDLALFPFAGDLARAGVNSFKIEGRMKSVHYIAAVVSFYRQVIDGTEFSVEEGFDLLGRLPNRGYSYGFMKGTITPEDYSTGQTLSQADSIFVGNVLAEKIDGKSVVEVRNKIHAGEKLELLKTDGSLSEIEMPTPLVTTDAAQEDFVNNSRFILLDDDLPEYAILRRPGHMPPTASSADPCLPT